MMQCENYTLSPMDYFLAGERRHKRCTSEAKWIVSVNPPNSERDGKVRLCDHCNSFDYRTFPREPL